MPDPSMKSRIYYAKPSITAREIEYATDAATHGWGERCYEYIERFESLFRQHLGVAHALATSSCTGALHLGLAALGLGPGDEVILGDLNWIASAAPIRYVGATPVLVDVLPDSWCVDPDCVEAAITPRTKAILAVHLYGNLCDMDALLDIGRRHSIPVVEDAAEGLGSVWRGRRAGSMGAFGVFSFHGSKTVTTGEGGMLVTNDENLHKRVETLSNHGRARGEKRQFWPERLGYKYKIANVSAAIGCAQVERIDELLAGKRRVFSSYKDKLRNLPIRMNPEPPGTINGYWMPTVVVDEQVRFNREELLQGFHDANIDGRVFFWPLTSLPMFGGKRNKVAYSIYPRACNLPSYEELTELDIDRVVETLKQHIGSSSA